MNISLKLEGIDKFREKLEEMGSKGEKIENNALEEGGKIILKEMQRTCPVRTGKAKKSLTISKPKKEKGTKIVKIGIQKDDNSSAYYLKYYEYGTTAHTYTAGGKYKGATVHHPGQIARPFMRPAYDRTRNEALEKSKDIIREALGLK